VERRKAWRMLQSKAGIENREYKAQRAILADVEAGKISREDFFARAEELLKARLDIAAEETPRPAAHPAPAVADKMSGKVSETVIQNRGKEPPRAAVHAPEVVAKMSAILSETVSRMREKETAEAVVAMAAQVTIAKESDESADWDRGVQIRLMELDVDPGNDADGGNGKRPEN